MDVKELPRGERALEKSNSVTINVLPNGKAGFAGTYQAGTVQAHTVQANEFPTEADALEAALQWARERKIELLYVERS